MRNNILINQVVEENSEISFKETFPVCSSNTYPLYLTIKEDGSLCWESVDLTPNNLVNNNFVNTDIYYDNGRVGIGRSPLYTYIVDLAIPKNKKMTAFHIGDGSFGFSLGNGTSQGFIPEIIGVGSDKDDAGLYFVGIAGNDQPSDVPLLILDGRSTYNTKLTNRPIFGVTSGDYNNYSLLIDVSGNLVINGNIIINDLSLLDIIASLQKQINDLKQQLK